MSTVNTKRLEDVMAFLDDGEGIVVAAGNTKAVLLTGTSAPAGALPTKVQPEQHEKTAAIVAMYELVMTECDKRRVMQELEASERLDLLLIDAASGRRVTSTVTREQQVYESNRLLLTDALIEELYDTINAQRAQMQEVIRTVMLQQGSAAATTKGKRR
jgi:hypothetical protein